MPRLRQSNSSIEGIANPNLIELETSRDGIPAASTIVFPPLPPSGAVRGVFRPATAARDDGHTGVAANQTFAGNEISGSDLPLALQRQALQPLPTDLQHSAAGQSPMPQECETLNDARMVFDEMPVRSVVSWTAMISGYTRSGFYSESLTLFVQMLRSGILLDTLI